MDETMITLPQDIQRETAHPQPALTQPAHPQPVLPQMPVAPANETACFALPHAPMAMPVQDLSPAPLSLLPSLRMAWPRLTVRF